MWSRKKESSKNQWVLAKVELMPCRKFIYIIIMTNLFAGNWQNVTIDVFLKITTLNSNRKIADLACCLAEIIALSSQSKKMQ